jgi:ABC-2 type transport system ATP-binding protein
MRRHSRSLVAAALLCSALAASAMALPAQGDPAFSKQTLYFKVAIGPDNNQPCTIIGDLYLPSTASATNRVPAILTTNGFGGSKDDRAGVGAHFAPLGYAVLAYSGLGFGGSGCKITLDDPDYDGKAASQLVSYLGGKTGIAYTDSAYTTPAPALDVIKLDTKDHLGNKSSNDPRVGMFGESYGGGAQFAAAAVDPRIDALTPMSTWNDLSYSLGPNNTAQSSGVSTSTPGAAKLIWALGFSASGVQQGAEWGQADPARLVGCPNFADWVCPALVTTGTLGYPSSDTVAHLQHASVASVINKIKIPTLLIQGENDTLFNLNEAIATHRALKANGVATKLIWHSSGHSGPPQPGDVSWTNPDPATEYVSSRVLGWFDKYLKGSDVSTGPTFAYFRDWVSYSGIATPAYGTSSSYPVGSTRNLYLSGTTLTTDAAHIAKGTQTFVTPVAGVPTSSDPADVLKNYAPTQFPESDLPGTFAAWSSDAQASNLDVVGSPVLTLAVTSNSAAAGQLSGDTGRLVLFVKVLDVAPDGTASLIHALIAPVRVPDVTKPFTVTLPAIAHRFASGHRIELVVAGGSVNYRGGLTANDVAISTGSSGQVLKLPVVP